MSYANLNPSSLNSFRGELSRCLNGMDSDLEKLKSAFDKAEWNDPVAESVRVEINGYIDKYNGLTEDLNGIISSLDDMYNECEEYLKNARD